MNVLLKQYMENQLYKPLEVVQEKYLKKFVKNFLKSVYGKFFKYFFDSFLFCCETHRCYFGGFPKLIYFSK